MEEEHNQQSAQVNPLLSRVQMPGETFTLPSGGLFYTDGELDSSVKNAEVRVRPMTALDEVTIKTPDMLFSGDAIREVFGRCIPQVKKPGQLLAKDVDFLLVCLRKVSYGDEIRVEHRHDCDDAKYHTYSVDVGQFIRNAKRIDPTTVATRFGVKMPNDQVVHMQPLRYKDFVKILQSQQDEDSTPEQMRDYLVDSIANVITQVDEIKDQKMIKEWLAEVPPSFLQRISEKVDTTLEWGPEFDVTVPCKDCGNSTTLTAPMNPLYFFM